MVGAYFGGPAGAQLGFVLGNLAGSALFPTQLPSGPRITDTRTTTSVVGGPVAIVFGTCSIAGTVMDLGKLVTIDKKAGKGGPQQETFSYTQTIAIGLAERVDDTAPDTVGAIGGISRIWENGALVFDIRPQRKADVTLGITAETDLQYHNRLVASAAYSQTFTLYLGDELQEADPTLEAIHGFGNTPAFRGLAYIVYPNRALQISQGMRHPNFQFEVFQSGANCRDVVTTSNEVLYPWFDARNEYSYTIQVVEAHSPTTGANPQGMTFTDIGSLLAAARAFNGIDQSVQIGYVVNTSCSGHSTYLVPLPGSYDIGQVVGGVTLDPTCVQLNYNFTIPHDGFQLPAGDPNTDPTSIHRSANKTWWQQGTIWHTTDVPGSNDFGFPPWDVPYRTGSRDVSYWWYEQVDDLIVQQYRRPGRPAAPCDGLTPAPQEGFAIDAYGNLVKCDSWVKDTSHVYNVLQKFIGETSAGENSNFTTQHPLGPAVVASDPNFDNEAFWTSAYAEAVARGDMPAGLVFHTHYPQSQAFAYTLTQRVCTGTCTDASEVSNDVQLPWNVGGTDPRAAGQQYTYQFQRFDGGTDVPPVRTLLETAMGDAVDGGVLNTPFTLQPRLYGWSTCPAARDNGTLEPWYAQSGIHNSEACYPPVDARHMPITYMWFNRLVPNGPLDYSVINVTESFNACQFVQSKPSGFWWIGESNYSGTINSVPGHGIMTWPFPTNLGTFNCTEGNSIIVIYDDCINVTAVPQAPLDPCFSLPASSIPGYCVREDGKLIKGGAWTLDTTKSYRVLHSGPWVYGSPYVSYLNPCLAPDDPNYSDSAFWTAAYNAAVTAGDLPAGWAYGLQFPMTQNRAWTIDIQICEAAGGVVSIASIIAAICRRSGLLDFDVTDLASVNVDGYAINTVCTGSSIIAPLRSVGFFDCVETGGLIKFATRGKAVVATFNSDDFGAYDAARAGGNAPASITTSRSQDEDLPRQIRLHYIAQSRDYGDGEQQSPFRLNTQARNDLDVTLPVCLGDTQALQCASVMWSHSWAAQQSYSLAIDQAWLNIDVGDCIAVPVDGFIKRMLISSDTNASAVLRKLSCVGDDSGAYISFAVASPPAYKGQQLSFIGQAVYEMLDLPALQDADSNAGFYVAAQRDGTGDGWSGQTVFKSVDGGATFTPYFSLATEATLGTIPSAVAPSEYFTWDTSTVITVNVATSDYTFSSVSDDAVLAGQNAAAMGADGRWEILQFATATQVSPTQWHLSRLLRGRRGTEHVLGSSQAGDTFVMISTGDIGRMALQLSEIGATEKYASVSIGTSFSGGAQKSFAGHAVALMPFSPVDVTAARSVSTGDMLISWIRRDRLGRTLMSGVDMPLSEATLAFQVDILEEASPGTVLRTLSVTTVSAIYTHAQQLADLGASPLPGTLRVAVYQISAVVGRGYPALATLTVGTSP